MLVRKVDTRDKDDVGRFIRFPFDLYRFCTQWVPPLVSGVRADLDRRRHPFYRHSKADFFLAESEGQTLGRVAVMYNRNFNAYQRSNVAFFGYFEAVQDREVARALFQAALGWARARGASEIAGPKGLIGSDGGGVLVDGFGHRPVVGTSYNFPYYEALLRDVGLVKDRDFLSARVDHRHRLPQQFYQAAERVRERRGLQVLSFRSRREMLPWVQRAVEAHGRAFSHNYTYYPPTPEEATRIVDTVLRIADPRLIKLVLKGDEIVGVVLGLPDVAAGLQRARGRLWPLGWFHILREKRRTSHALLPALGFLPGYQGLGGNALLYAELARTLASSHYRSVEFMQVDEENFKSIREIRIMGSDSAGDVEWYKTHRLYRRAV